jgi:hypothetical protein
MTEDQCHSEAERLFGVVATTSNVDERRRLIDEAMRWHNRAMIAHDHDLQRPSDDREA